MLEQLNWYGLTLKVFKERNEIYVDIDAFMADNGLLKNLDEENITRIQDKLIKVKKNTLYYTNFLTYSEFTGFLLWFNQLLSTSEVNLKLDNAIQECLNEVLTKMTSPLN